MTEVPTAKIVFDAIAYDGLGRLSMLFEPGRLLLVLGKNGGLFGVLFCVFVVDKKKTWILLARFFVI